VEGENSRLRHYLARLHRKTFYYSKSVEMLELSIRLLIYYLKHREIPMRGLRPRFDMAIRVRAACPFGEAVPQAQDSASSLRLIHIVIQQRPCDHACGWFAHCGLFM
jgi:hypothetical protein